MEVISPDRPSTFVNLGPHPPRLWPEDVELLHDLWLKMCHGKCGSKLHHRDVVGIALWRLQRDLDAAGSRGIPGCDEIIGELPPDSRIARELHKPGTPEPDRYPKLD